MGKTLILVLLLGALAVAQMPAPALPTTYIDTTWNPPVSGMIWQAHTSNDLRNLLVSANPGDTIILDAGSVYSGNFTLPAKANPNGKWIYIESSALTRLPVPGTQVAPTDAVNMPRIVTPNSTPPITIAPNADHWRLVGLEVTSASTQGCNPHNVPPVNCYTFFLIYPNVAQNGSTGPLPDSITVDRCYIHGSPTQDVREGVNMNGTNFALIDSCVSDIHQSTADSQAAIAYYTPGPLKIVDNFLSATTEDIMFGGAGGYNNPFVPSDIEVRRNHLFKPLSWDAPHITLPPAPMWVEKNNLEFKSAQRVIVTGNVFENTWVSGQVGFAVVLTPRTGQSGNIAVVDDITIESNFLVNVTSGFNPLASDNNCGPQYGYPSCTNPGEEKRIKIDNNLIQFMNPTSPGGARNWGLQAAVNLTDVVFQHNTEIPAAGTTCGQYGDQAIYFVVQQGLTWPLQRSDTHNVWILDNVLCRQTTGDFGGQGTTGLQSYMSDPDPLATRYWGNVMFVPSGDRVAAWPVHNYATPVPLTYANPAGGNYQLLTPYWMDTSDGKLAGIDWTALQGAVQALHPRKLPLMPR